MYNVISTLSRGAWNPCKSHISMPACNVTCVVRFTCCFFCSLVFTPSLSFLIFSFVSCCFPLISFLLYLPSTPCHFPLYFINMPLLDVPSSSCLDVFTCVCPKCYCAPLKCFRPRLTAKSSMLIDGPSAVWSKNDNIRPSTISFCDGVVDPSPWSLCQTSVLTSPSNALSLPPTRA